MLIKEACVENFTHIPAVIANGANRIELCDNLAVGGTTVSTGVMEESIRYCHEKSIPIMAIIRPRGGDFVYHDTELNIMSTDIIEAKKMGVDGVVIGALTEDGWIDEEAMLQFIEEAEGLQITFHMAFDQIPLEKQLAAIDWLAENGVHRILSHGHTDGATPITGNLPHLKQLVEHAKGRMIILPGGGVTAENAQTVADTINVNEVHGTKIV